jgi:hypothetical protein
MNVFTPAEIAYLQDQLLGRLASVGSDGQPHVSPARSGTMRSWTPSISTGTTSPGARSTTMCSATQGWRSSWTIWNR